MDPNSTNQYDKKFYFDKILCDVPCTGDGAIRKIPNKWVKWKAKDGYVLYPL
jgi:16S rRNA C967 or C1407 C5-methylase (RsmB/RsmF family)